MKKAFSSLLVSTMLLTGCIALPELEDKYKLAALTYSQIACKFKDTAEDLHSVDMEKLQRIVDRFFKEEDPETKIAVPLTEEELNDFMSELGQDPVQMGLFIKEVFDQTTQNCDLTQEDVENMVNALNAEKQQ